MKIQAPKTVRQQGSALLAALIVSTIMGITLASYLILASNQNTSVVRSQTWNSSIALSEAGVEDALQLLNKYSGTFDKLTNWPSTSGADAWSVVANNVYYVRRTLGDSYYDIWVTNSALTPAIRAIGYIAWPYAVASAPQTMFATVGYDATTGNRVMVKRRVDVQTRIDPLFAVAMAAKRQIDFSGKNVNTDSFDSADPLYSNGGMYPAGLLNKTKANGDVVTDYTIINSLNVGNAKIKGQVKTGPNGTMAIGPGGSVGDKSWVEGGSLGVQPGHSANDMNVLFPDVVMPVALWTPAVPNNLTINGNNYTYAFLVSGDYSVPGFSGSVYVGTNVNVRLKITGDVALTGNNDVIRIAYGGSLKIYMLGANFSVKGQGIVNETGFAENCYYFGLPSNTSIDFGGNANFIGAVYAPEANFSLGGGGANTFDFIGASVTLTVKMNGHFNFHYDENLRRNTMGRGYIPTNWKES